MAVKYILVSLLIQIAINGQFTASFSLERAAISENIVMDDENMHPVGEADAHPEWDSIDHAHTEDQEVEAVEQFRKQHPQHSEDDLEDFVSNERPATGGDLVTDNESQQQQTEDENDFQRGQIDNDQEPGALEQIANNEDEQDDYLDEEDYSYDDEYYESGEFVGQPKPANEESDIDVDNFDSDEEDYKYDYIYDNEDFGDDDGINEEQDFGGDDGINEGQDFGGDDGNNEGQDFGDDELEYQGEDKEDKQKTEK